MNNDLACGNIYTKLDQKSVTAWLELRNRAAHGRYGDFSGDQVRLVLQGHSGFYREEPLKRGRLTKRSPALSKRSAVIAIDLRMQNSPSPPWARGSG